MLFNLSIYRMKVNQFHQYFSQRFRMGCTVLNFYNFNRMQSRRVCYKSNESYDRGLRNSTNFLNSELLRGSLTPTYSPNNFRSSNFHNIMGKQRFSSLTKRNLQSIQQSDIQHQSYAHLKDTLSELQLKIKKAKDILSKSSKSIRRPQILLDCEETISEIQSNITKKNDYTYNQLTDNSTKFLSFVKNQEGQSNSHGRSGFMKNKNIYYVNSVLNWKEDSRVQEHLQFSFRTFRSFQDFRAKPSNDLQVSYLPLIPRYYGKKTILLDIDETILHCQQIPKPNQKFDLELQIPISQTDNVYAYVNLRPYALTFLKNISKNFEVISFSASHPQYIKRVLDDLDPQGDIFSHRLYKDSCQQLVPDIYGKDIRVINRSPQKVILIDNSPYSFIFQLQNAVPIIPYYEGPDNQLPKLEKYLQLIDKSEDVREINKKTFKLFKYTQFKNINDLVQNLYVNP